MKTEDIEETIQIFKTSTNINDRYTSFDYCYNYFRESNNKEDIEKSCLVLGFYLASWGMFRGSSFILQKSAKYFQPAIEYISKLDQSVWEIDVNTYNSENIEVIIDIYNAIKHIIIKNGNSDLTLITKILMGVFGFIPAYDQYFCNSFRVIFKGKCGFRRVNKKSLNCIKDFYTQNRIIIDRLSKETFTTDFLSGEKTDIKYPKAKIIDMYGFTTGYNQMKKTKQ